MQKEIKKELRSLIKGGMATTGPPLGPACGKFVSNLKEMISKINDLTKEYKGYSVYVYIKIYTDRSYEVSIHSIPLSTRIKQKVVSNKLTEKDVVEISKETFGTTDAKTLEKHISEVKKTIKSHKIKII